MNHKVRGYEYRSTIVCIDDYDEHILCGRFYNAFQKEGEYFGSLMEFLLKMEQMLDTMCFPQSFSTPRTFRQPTEHTQVRPPGGGHRCGKLATFEVRVLFRQNASWQGCITWLEEGMEENFRSVLELAILMDSALTSLKRERSPA